MYLQLQDENTGEDGYNEVVLEHGAKVGLTNASGIADQSSGITSIILEQGQVQERYLKIKVSLSEYLKCIDMWNVKRVEL